MHDSLKASNLLNLLRFVGTSTASVGVGLAAIGVAGGIAYFGGKKVYHNFILPYIIRKLGLFDSRSQSDIARHQENRESNERHAAEQRARDEAETLAKQRKRAQEDALRLAEETAKQNAERLKQKSAKEKQEQQAERDIADAVAQGLDTAMNFKPVTGLKPTMEQLVEAFNNDVAGRRVDSEYIQKMLFRTISRVSYSPNNLLTYAILDHVESNPDLKNSLDFSKIISSDNMSLLQLATLYVCTTEVFVRLYRITKQNNPDFALSQHRTTDQHETLLHLAARNRSISQNLILKLIDIDRDIDRDILYKLNQDNQTALEVAVLANNTEAATTLLDYYQKNNLPNIRSDVSQALGRAFELVNSPEMAKIFQDIYPESCTVEAYQTRTVNAKLQEVANTNPAHDIQKYDVTLITCLLKQKIHPDSKVLEQFLTRISSTNSAFVGQIFNARKEYSPEVQEKFDEHLQKIPSEQQQRWRIE